MRIGLLWVSAWGTAVALPGQPLLKPLLKIVAPPNGTVVRPGESINVRVEASSGLSGIALICSDPIPFAPPLETPPYKFKVEIPGGIAPGSYTITANGITSDSQLKADTITIRVERPDSPLELHAQPQVMKLNVGEGENLEVSGRFANGSTIRLTLSTLNRFASDQPRIASVDEYGKVMGVAPGSTKIRIKNGKSQTEVQVIVVKTK